MTTTKPFYRLVERKPNPPYTDRLVFQNDHDHKDRVEFSEWWFWRLWRYSPGWLAYQGQRDFVAIATKLPAELDEEGPR